MAGGQTVTVTCSPSLSASGDYIAQASVGYTVSVAPVVINLAGPIVDNTGDLGLLIGQGVSASLSAGSCALSNYQWYAPGDTFLEFYTNSAAQLGYPILTSSSTWSSATPAWYWWDNGGTWGAYTNEAIGATATAVAPDGTNLGTVEAGKTLDLWAPSALMRLPDTTDGGGPSSWEVGNFLIGGVTSSPVTEPNGDVVPGMQFEIDTTTPSSFFGEGYGSTEDVQLVNINRWVDIEFQYPVNIGTNGTVELDNVFPYGDTGSGQPYNYGNSSPTTAANPFGLTFYDTPQLSWSAGATGFSLNDDYYTYILYRAPGQNTQPVPVWETQWTWAGSGTFFGGAGTPLQPGETGILSNAYTTQFPTWSATFTNTGGR